MRRREFFRRLVAGAAATYASPGVLEGLAASSPVQHGAALSMEELLHRVYLPGIVAQFDAAFYKNLSSILTQCREGGGPPDPGGRQLYIETAGIR